MAWIGATQTFLTYLMCTVSGRLCDAGHARPVTLAGTALVTVGTLATSLAAGSGDGHYWATFLAQGVCTGLGLGLLTAPGLTAITAYFRRKRSLALSVATMGTSFGSAVFPAVVQYLIPTVGFPWAVRCSAAVSLVFGLVAYALLLPPPPRLRRRRGAAPAAAAAEQQADPPARSLVDWPAFREPPFVCFVVASFLIFWALYFGFFYVSFPVPPLSLKHTVSPDRQRQINVFGEDVLAFPPASAASLLIIATATGMPMRPLAGYVADFCLGAVNTFALSAAFLAATLFAWTGVHTAPAMYVFAVLFGLANGAAQGVWVGCLVALTRDQARVGTRFGMVCTLAAFAALAGPPTASSIVGATGTYTWAQLWAGAAIMLGTAAVVVGRTYLVGCRVCVRV